jgi:glycosyltransferase involved in cell wall biosynthesis
MTSAAVSVIIPAYNPGGRLQVALRTVLAQTFQDWEVVVVDDGGNEDLSWVESMDARISLHRQENQGVSVARNVGATLAAGPLVAFLDQDDEWLPDKLATQVAGMRGECLSHTDFWFVRGSGAELARHPGPVTYLSVLAGGPPCLSSAVVERSALLSAGGFNGLLAQTQDYDLFLRLLMRGRAHHVASPLVRYHLHDDNASKDYAAGRTERQLVLRLHEHAAQYRGDQKATQAARMGRRSGDALYAAQALDAARDARRQRQSPLPALSEALMWSPATTIRSLGAGLMANARGTSGSLSR